MKIKIILILFPVLSALSGIAQDTIVKLSGDTIFAKVLEINQQEIKYKRWNMLDGPTYIEYKSKIDYIKYANGVKEMMGAKEVKKETDTYVEQDKKEKPKEELSNKIFEVEQAFIYKNEKLTEQQMQNKLLETKDKHIMGLVQQAQKAKGIQNIGYGAFGFGLGATFAIPYWAIYAFAYNNNGGPSYNKSDRNKYGALAANMCGRHYCLPYSFRGFFGQTEILQS